MIQMEEERELRFKRSEETLQKLANTIRKTNI